MHAEYDVQHARQIRLHQPHVSADDSVSRQLYMQIVCYLHTLSKEEIRYLSRLAPELHTPKSSCM